jgi:hypothetical protein
MMPTKWNVIRLSGIGFLCGAVFSPTRELLENGGVLPEPAYLIGLIIGGGIGGAILFAVVATIRNFFVK